MNKPSKIVTIGGTGIAIVVVGFLVLLLRGGSSETKLVSAFERNEPAAEDEYSEKDVSIKATIASIDTSMNGLQLDLGGRAIATMKESEHEAVKTLRRGQQVLLDCTCRTRILGILNLNDCTIAD